MYRLRALVILIAIALAPAGFCLAQPAGGDLVLFAGAANGAPASLVHVSTESGQVHVLAELPGITDPRDLAILPNGHILLLHVMAASNTAGGTTAAAARIDVWDPQANSSRVLATLPGSHNPSGLALLAPDRILVCDPTPPAASDPSYGAYGGVILEVDGRTGEHSVLLQTPRLPSPADISGLAGHVTIADQGANSLVNTSPFGGVYGLDVENGDLTRLNQPSDLLRPRRLDASAHGIAVLDDLTIHLLDSNTDTAKRVFAPVPSPDLLDLCWGADGSLYLLDSRVGPAVYAVDQDLQPRLVAKSPLLAGAVAMVTVPQESRRVGILKNPVARGVREPVTVEVSMTGAENLGALRVELLYDPTQATPGTPVLSGFAEEFTTIADAQPGRLTWQFFDVEGDGVDYDLPELEPVVLVRVPFHLKNSLGNDTRVPLRIDKSRTEAFDVDVLPLPLQTVDGYIAVVRGLAGDINNDGRVNSGDAVLALQHGTRRNLSPVQQARGDVNNDGNINTGDALLILRTATGIREATSF